MKNLWIIFLIVILLFGCTSKSEKNSDTQNLAGPETNKNTQGIVIRSFSSSSSSVGETIEVTITKNLNSDQTTLLIEDSFPEEWEVVNPGSGNIIGNTIRWAELNTAKSGKFVYSLRVGSGDSVWSGQYSVMGRPPIDIVGEKEIIIN